MARTLIHLPANPKRGDVIEVRTTIAHIMETGVRADAEGRVVPRDIITHFECRYDGQPVFAATLYPAIAANPYLAFQLKVEGSGTLTFAWTGDNGFSQTETVALTVAA